MEGIISEGNKMMSEDMSSEVADAVIIASAQKVEHYEISGYGTAAAYARELNLRDIANKLQQTLKEEYEADDKLTELAVGKVNVEAEFAEGSENDTRRSKTTSKKLVAKSSSNGVGAKSSWNKNKRTTSRSNGKAATSKSKSSTLGSTNKSSASKSLSKKTSSSNGRNSMSKTTSKKRSDSNSKASGSRKALQKVYQAAEANQEQKVNQYKQKASHHVDGKPSIL